MVFLNVNRNMLPSLTAPNKSSVDSFVKAFLRSGFFCGSFGKIIFLLSTAKSKLNVDCKKLNYSKILINEYKYF